MESTRTRIRRDYEPLTVVANTFCLTPDSPTTQVFNALDGNQYEPDRNATPTVLYPEVIANAKDGSWKNPQANKYLTNMVWKVNGVSIKELRDWNGMYEIDESDSYTKGSIKIYKNIPANSSVALKFQAEISDYRLGVNIAVSTDNVYLSTTVKSEDEFSISVNEDSDIIYDHMIDKLLEYNYKVAHGIIIPSSNLENEAKADEGSYLRKITFDVYRGKNKINSGYSVEVYKGEKGVFSTLIGASSPEISSMDNKSITFDLRVCEKGDYLLKVKVGNRYVAQHQVSINRIYREYTISPTNGTSILPNDETRYDKAMVECNGKIVNNPSCFLSILWKTDTQAKKGVFHNEGDETIFSIAYTGLGDTFNDGWLDVYIESEHKQEMSVATDNANNVLVDENGNTLIFN